MKRLVVVALLLTACGSETKLPDFPNRCTATTACESAVAANQQEFLAAIDALHWEQSGSYSTGCLRASRGLRATGTVELTSNSIQPPESCRSKSGCRPEVTFVISREAAGVTCTEAAAGWPSSCSKVTITDADVRIRPLVRDTHPGMWSYEPVIEILPPCTQPCAEGQFKCEATQLCWDSAGSYCAHCLNGDPAVCACWNGTAFEANGTTCSYPVSGDALCGGTCIAGVCEPSGTAPFGCP